MTPRRWATPSPRSARSLARRAQCWSHTTCRRGHHAARARHAPGQRGSCDWSRQTKAASGSWSFKISSTEIARDREGDPVTAPVADFGGARAPDRPKARLRPNARTALRFLHDLLCEEGKSLPSAWQMPSDVRAVPLERWRASCLDRGLSADRDSFRTTFRRAHAALLAAGRIASREYAGEILVWPTRPEGGDS